LVWHPCGLVNCHAVCSPYRHKPNKGEKEIARSMMLMTMDISKKYFGVEHSSTDDSLMTISCISCYRDIPHPDKAELIYLFIMWFCQYLLSTIFSINYLTNIKNEKSYPLVDRY